MSRQATDGEGMAGLPQRVANWLRSLGQREPPAPPPVLPPDPQRAAALLQRAAQCYARAGWPDDAVRLFVQLGNDRQAAPYHEQLGHWEAAAACYTRLGDWGNAARCHLAAKQPAESAECTLKAGQPYDAAWLWADQAHHFRRAEATLSDITPATESDRIAVALIQARCEAGLGAATSAARRLNRAIVQLRSAPPDLQHRRLHDWAHTVARVLHRPDLTVLIHASAVATGLPNAQADWASWAAQALGDATGVSELPIDKLASRTAQP